MLSIFQLIAEYGMFKKENVWCMCEFLALFVTDNSDKCM